MNKLFIFKPVLVLSLVSSMIFTGCATSQTEGQVEAQSKPQSDTRQQSVKATSENAYAGKANAVSVKSRNGAYNVSLYSNDAKLPLRRIHSWTVHIETKDGKPVEDARVFVFGGMPAHRHGFPTRPIAKKYLGNGDYLVEGIKFSMPGAWQMRFNIKQGRKSDRVVFDINLK